jgi:hypothetical protein
MIHYPQDRASAMVTHLASLAEKRIVLSFAPYTLAYAVLKRIGELFPGPSKVSCLLWQAKVLSLCAELALPVVYMQAPKVCCFVPG